METSVLGSGSCKTVSEWKLMTGRTSAKPATRASFLSLRLRTVCSLSRRCVTVTLYWPVCVCVCSQMLWSVLESHAHRCPSPNARLIQSWPAVTRLLPDVARRHLLSARVPAARLLRTAATGTEQCWLKRAPERRETAATRSHAKEVKSCLYWVFLLQWRPKTSIY